MKKNTIQFIAVTFVTIGITEDEGKQVYRKWMPFGNGFPSVYQYNLNIPGKQGHFICPPPEYVDGTRVCGNVMFIPWDHANDPITILMEAGGKGPEGAQDTSMLKVTDQCTGSFPDSGSGRQDTFFTRHYA
jgi:hypothetical protein